MSRWALIFTPSRCSAKASASIRLYFSTLDQRAGDTGARGILQGHVDGGIADPALKMEPIELQRGLCQILDVDGHQLRAMNAVHQVPDHHVAAVQFLLVEVLDGAAEGIH